MKKNEKTTVKHETISCNEKDIASVLFETIMAAVWEEQNKK